MPIVTVALSKPLPSGLAPELRSRLFFVSPQILDFSLVEAAGRIEAVILTTADDAAPDLADKVRRVVAADIARQKVFKSKVVWRSEAGGGSADTLSSQGDLFESLVSAGVAYEAGEGQVGFGEPLIGLMHYFDRRITQIALAMPNAQEFQYPTLLPTSVLDAFGYFGSFPHFAMFVTRLHNDIDVYESFRADYAEHGRIPETLFSHCGNHDYCLPPTMCYHTYHQLRDTTLPADRVVTAKGKSFRFEAKYYRGMERLWDFTIREIVFLGSRESVVERRDAFMRSTFALMDEFGLCGFGEVANDPFFVTQDTAGKILNQRMMELKYELRLFVDSARTIAAGSFNFHENFFGESFRIRHPDEAAITTGCVGIGLERLVYAFLCQYGLDKSKWPDSVRTGVAANGF